MAETGLVIDLGDLTFNDGATDPEGRRWWIQRLEGWDAPPTRQTIENVTSRHGGVQGEHLLDPRPLTVGGIVKCPDEATYWATRDLLATVVGLYGDVFLTVHEPTPKRCAVRRSSGSSIRIEAPNGTSTVKFEFSLVALDPLKYALTEQTSTLDPGESAYSANAGNWPTFPTMTTAGNGTVALRNQTAALSLTTGAKTTIDPLVADFRTRTLAVHAGGGVAGDNRYGLLDPASRWWALEPGVNEINNLGGQQVTYRWRDAWL